jgi:hypothetical protein
MIIGSPAYIGELKIQRKFKFFTDGLKNLDSFFHNFGADAVTG